MNPISHLDLRIVKNQVKQFAWLPSEEVLLQESEIVCTWK